jgi:hypothetical protein
MDAGWDDWVLSDVHRSGTGYGPRGASRAVGLPAWRCRPAACGRASPRSRHELLTHFPSETAVVRSAPSAASGWTCS